MPTIKNPMIATAAAKKKDPSKYRWFTLDKGRVKFDSAHDDYELALHKGEKFGLKFFKGSYFMLTEEDLSIQFRLTEKEGKDLMARSTGFSGKIGGKSVKAGGDKPKKESKPAKEKKAPKEKKPKPDKDHRESKSDTMSEHEKRMDDYHKLNMKDEFGKPALSDEALPKDLKKHYEKTMYGRVISTGRSRGASHAVYVGTAMRDGKTVAVLQPINHRSGKESYLFIPMGRLRPDEIVRNKQVPYDQMLSLREQARKSFTAIKDRKEERREQGKENLKKLDLRTGMYALIRWSNVPPNWKQIQAIDYTKMRIGIQGSGRKLRYIPMALVLDAKEAGEMNK